VKAAAVEPESPRPKILHLCNLQYWQLSNTSGRIASPGSSIPRIPDSPLAAVVGFVLAFLSKAILHFLWLGLLINSAKLCIFSSFSRQHFPARLFHSHHLVFSAALCADFNTFRNFRVGHEIGRGQRARGIGTGTGTVKQAQPTNCIRVEFWQQHLLLLSHLHFLLWHFNENLNN